MIRVLFVENSKGLGGAQLALYQLLKFFSAENIEPIVVSVIAGPLHNQIKHLPVNTLLLPQCSSGNPFCLTKQVQHLVSLVRQVKPHIICSNDYGGHLFGGIVARLCRIPEIWWVHGIKRFTIEKDSLMQHIVAAIPATKILANSVWLKEQLETQYNLRSSVLYYGIDVEGLVQSADGNRVRRELGIAPDELVATIIGRLDRGKGQHIFLEAAASVLQHHPGGRFLIVGGTTANSQPEYPAFLSRRVRDLGIEDHVLMTGFQAKVAGYYAASDVIVHAASGRLQEAFGLVIAEAMALSKPVIATRCGGPAEIVEHGKTGFLVEPDDPESIAAYLDSLFEDTQLRQAMGRAGFERVSDQFSMKKHVKAFQELILEQAGESRL